MQKLPVLLPQMQSLNTSPLSLPDISSTHPMMVLEVNKAMVQVLRVLEAPCTSQLRVAAAVRALSEEKKLGEFVDSVYPWIQQAFVDRDKEGLECHLESGLAVQL